MAFREEDIQYENGIFTVIEEGGVHKVLVSTTTHSVHISNFDGTPDGLSCAEAWVDYVVKHYSVESIAKLADIYPSTVIALRRSRERQNSQWNTNTTPSVSAITTGAA
jgi:hypothetical protein